MFVAMFVKNLKLIATEIFLYDRYVDILKLIKYLPVFVNNNNNYIVAPHQV